MAVKLKNDPAVHLYGSMLIENNRKTHLRNTTWGTKLHRDILINSVGAGNHGIF